MATDSITPPAGYTIEQPSSAATPPPGYTLEGSAPPQAPPAPAPEKFSDWPPPKAPPAIPPQDHKEELVKSIAGDAGLNTYRSARDTVSKIEQLVKSPTAAYGAARAAVQGIGSNIMSHLTPEPDDLEVAHHDVKANPVIPNPGAGALAGDFSDEEAASQAAAPASSTASDPSIVQKVMKGKGVAQAPAQQAIRSSVGASADTPILQGDQTIVDEPLNALETAKKTAYSKMDKAAGFDVKAEETQLKNDLYKRQQLGNTDADVAQRAKLDASITDSQQRLADAQGKMSAAGIDPNEAKTLNTQWKAGQDIKKIIVKNTSADGTTVKVDSLLNDLKKAQFSKYGNRVEQFLGTDAGGKLMGDLMQAQKVGASAVKMQTIAKRIALVAGTGAAVKGVGEVASAVSAR